MRPGAATRWASVFAIGVPTALVALHASRYGHWIVDDAGITFAYARSIASGFGPVLQPGATPVEGFSNPAWLGILVVGRWLHLFDRGTWLGVPDLVLFPKVVALLCCMGIFAGFHAITRAVSRHPARTTLAAGAITASIPSFVIWTMSGLENALLAFAVVTLAAVLVRAAVADRVLGVKTAAACGGLAALAALTRPDGVLYIAAYPVAAVLYINAGTVRTAMRAILISVASAAVPLGAYLVWRLVEFGRWLPNTAAAKQQGVPGVSDLNKPIDLVGYAGWMACVLTVVLAVIAIQRPGATRTALRMILIPLGLALLAYAGLATDWMTQYRFSTPVWPLAALVFAVSLAEVFRTFEVRGRVLMSGALAVVGLLALTGWHQRSEDFRTTATASVCYIARNTGYTFNSYADRLGIGDGTLLAVDGGGTSLTSRLHFVDLSGLADREIAEFWQHDDMSGLRDHVFERVQPTFIRIWHGWDGVRRSRILEDPRLARDYVPIWAPREGGGNWVRRDVVTDPTALAELQRDAPAIAALVDEPYVPRDMRWWCGPTLRPSAPGADPASDMDPGPRGQS